MIFGNKAAPNPKHNSTGTQVRRLVAQLDLLGLDPEEIGINTTVPGGVPAPASIPLVLIDELDEDPACYVLRYGDTWLNAALLIRVLDFTQSADAKIQFLWSQIRPGATQEQYLAHLVSLAPVQEGIQRFLKDVFTPVEAN